MRDRLTRGFISGIIAGIPTAVWNLLAKYLHLIKITYADFAAILTYGRNVKNISEFIFSFFSTFFWFGLLGILFIYLITKVTSKNLLLKGWIFGVTQWFLSYAVTLLFKVPELATINLATTLVHFIGASIWGITLAFIITKLDKLKA